jgi:hypothetical protein
MPCFYYSPNANASTKPKNVPFTEAELGSHVLRMCPIQWQDQYKMNKKGMMPMEMHLLLTLLEAIQRVCTYKKGKFESSKKSSNKGKKGKKHSGNGWFPRKSILRSIATCARSMGARIPCTTLVIIVGLKRMERRNPIPAPLRKAERKVIPQTRTSCS